MMDGIDWKSIGPKELDAFSRRVALAETLLDESIDEAARYEVRRAYRNEHGVTERTIRNYLKRYREEGPYGLLFYQRSCGQPERIQNTLLRDKILSLIEERPGRTVPQIRRMLGQTDEFSALIAEVSDRTIYRFLSEKGLTQKARMARRVGGGRASYHRFEASYSMALVQGDARDGIWLPKAPGATDTRKTYLFAWVDDHSRRILHAQYFWDEKLPRMEETFKIMVLRWGIPEKLYLDNGNVYIAAQFALALADLKIKKIHHGPYQAWCKGKVEAVMKTIKTEFQSEAQAAGFATLDELNSALWAWIDVEYNSRVHSSTGEPPAKRFIKGLPDQHRRVEDLQWFEALFLQRETRTVTKYGEIKLEGNRYKTAARHGTVVEVRYNPFSLRTVWRFENGKATETLGLKKLVHESAKQVTEERQCCGQKISDEAAGYFQRLREQHMLQAEHLSEPLRYSKLKEGGKR